MIPDTKIVAAEPEGAARMHDAQIAGKPVTTDTISRFCDGSAVKMVK
jgi:threonine dehydratase